MPGRPTGLKRRLNTIEYLHVNSYYNIFQPNHDQLSDVDDLPCSGGARKISLPGHNRGTIISNRAHAIRPMIMI